MILIKQFQLNSEAQCKIRAIAGTEGAKNIAHIAFRLIPKKSC